MSTTKDRAQTVTPNLPDVAFSRVGFMRPTTEPPPGVWTYAWRTESVAGQMGSVEGDRNSEEETLKACVLQSVRQHRGWDDEQIATSLGCPTFLVSEALRALEAEGKVEGDR